jgi:hypothetical protein
MATWNEVKNYVRSNYQVRSESDDGNMLHLIFETEAGRSQMITVGFLDTDPAFVTFRSVFASTSQVSALKAFEVASATPFGIGMAGEIYFLNHAQLAATIDPDEIDVPMRWVTLFADYVEKQLGLGDSF